MAKKIISLTLAFLILFSALGAVSASADNIIIMATLTIKVGETKPLRFTEPDGTHPSLKWKSSKPSVAYVDAKGNVTGKKAGSSVVSTRWKGRPYGIKIVVKQPSKKVAISKSAITLSAGKTYALKLNNANASKVKWSVSDKKVASVSSKGTVKGIKAGKVRVVAKYGGKSYKCIVTVKKAVKKIALNKKALTLKAGKTYALKLNNAKPSKVKWKSANRKIAKVSSKGVVKAKRAGKVIISAKYGKNTYKCVVTVKKK